MALLTLFFEKYDELVILIVSSLPVIPPSTYSYVLPISTIENIDQLAISGIFPSIRGLAPAFLYALLFGILRMILFSIVLKPLAIHLLGSSMGKFRINQKSEAKFNRENNDQTKKLIPQEIRHHRIFKKKITKFTEAMWRFIFYFFMCIIGFKTLVFSPSPVSWIKDTRFNWIEWPLHLPSALMNFYYQIELGCYIHQLMWTEVARSDAAEMILHHFITIILIVLSYLTNFMRIGSSILVIHDFADIFLESGKCFNYMSKVEKYKWAGSVTDIFFGFFTISFFVTRLVIYPRLVYSYVVEAPEIMGSWPGYWIFAVLLISLQCLHIFWFYLICKMIYKLFIVGAVVKDERSDDEDEDESNSKKSKSS
eukprot:gene5921-8166_t